MACSTCAAYDAYLSGELEDNVLSAESLAQSLSTVPVLP